MGTFSLLLMLILLNLLIDLFPSSSLGTHHSPLGMFTPISNSPFALTTDRIIPLLGSPLFPQFSSQTSSETSSHLLVPLDLIPNPHLAPFSHSSCFSLLLKLLGFLHLSTSYLFLVGS
ncbi:unnamed protein product [Microthlaspi erraticum]|uniref:Uncharacterized protein n=1 Tax=Microthlaspi erraticum TaxID=1685480 RepID=A0A6D2HYG6_9BRAS|nr:unnamed protein product [Microthlaspi erraticum]